MSDVLASARTSVTICAPYITLAGSEFVAKAVARAESLGPASHIVTDLSPTSMCQGSTDPEAVRSLARSFRGATVFHLPRLHAKVYIADQSRAVITSGNLTRGGLFMNYEYGVEINDPGVVSQVRTDVLDIALLGAAMSDAVLTSICEAAAEARAAYSKQIRSASRAAQQGFTEAFRLIEERVLGARLSGGPIHTVFARTIEYLLRRQHGMTTPQLHAQIAAIHPDLCDDSVDRVINGVHFGKKWKHAVRTAQQMLKKKGTIVLESGVWRFVGE